MPWTWRSSREAASRRCWQRSTHDAASLKRGPRTSIKEATGIGIGFELSDSAIVVFSSPTGTQAFSVGLCAGDRIVELDHHPLPKRLPREDARDLLDGPLGSTLSLTVEREGDPLPLQFDIERGSFPSQSVPYAYMVRPDLGYVLVTRFSLTTGDEFKTAPNRYNGTA